ncbi:UNVERIFIED_CONTAM: Cysteine proteinase RD21A [Sesamum latifolium]|uniref:Cysteine proteinase RD21A n=1 Tax=Sesamum latifolium TaxID=2727402 RepID=A0AAW2WFA1_9LAMI
MAAPSSSAVSLSFLLLFLSVFFAESLGSDMSIISYDERHGGVKDGARHEEVMSMYESWMVKHSKSYNALGEKEKRFEIFKDNLRYIEEQNAMPNRTYKLGLNRFADLSNEEYRKLIWAPGPTPGAGSLR